VQSNDLSELRTVIAESRHTHLQLDWWTFEDWVDNPGFLVAEQDKHIVGFGMGVRDASPAAWLRALVAQDGLGVGALLDTLLPPMLAALRSQGVRALDCMAWPEWLAEKLPERGFSTMARVVTLRKDEMVVPISLTADASVREANSTDLDAVTAIDHAAFEEDWWYGQTTFFRALRGATRFVVAMRDGLPVGYAFAHMNGLHAHVTRLAVHPAYQRQGIGTLLMADSIEHLRAQGVETVTLNTQTYNENSLRLYRRLGFIETDTFVTAFSRVVT
jgi:ribosomal protein S18 acetylase RimI-like enzyme